MRTDFAAKIEPYNTGCFASDVVFKGENITVTQEEYEDIIAKKDEFDPSDMHAYLVTVPKYMDGETRLGKKEHYQDIVNKVMACKACVCEDNVVPYLLGTIETFANTSEQLFEHHMAIRTAFKEVLSEYKDKLCSMPPKKKIIAAYAINRAIDMKVLLAEKYEALVDKLMD
ncbi:MAG: hypothetical protein K6F17_05645 [Lachnospiraceae bacterium]|nr:hypothetical protein [Lachnospiraceae bacterium]